MVVKVNHFYLFSHQNGLQQIPPNCCIPAGVLVGKHKDKVSQIATHITFMHCIIHRENLASKTLDQQLKCVLCSAVKIVNYIKSRLILGPK